MIVLSDGRHGVNDGMINLDPKCEKIKLPGENSNERSEKIKSSTVNSTQKVCESVPLQVESKEEQERNAMMLNDYYYETRAKNEAERKSLNMKIMNSNRVNAANFVDGTTQTDDDVVDCQVTQCYLGNNQVLLFMQTIFFLFATWLNALAKDVKCCKEEMQMIRCYAQYNEVSENPDSDLPDAKIPPPLQLQLDDIQLRLTKVQTLLSGKIRCYVIGNDVDVNEVEEVAPDIVGEVDEPFEDIDAYSTPLNWSHANLTSCFSFG